MIRLVAFRSAAALLVVFVCGFPALPGQDPVAIRNEKIQQIVSEISAANLKRHVDSLAAIPSRHVASPGIWEAARYIQAEFQKSPRLKVELDEFEESLQRLGGKTLKMANVVATLPGTGSPDRYYVVSGHYDSRASDGRDAESPAPGAVDDASGTAVVLELARVLSQREFDASIVFVAFTAEEMGLVGSRHWARNAREQGLDVEAMITNDIVGNSRGGGGLIGNTGMRVFSEGVPVVEDERQGRLRQSIGGEVDSPARQLARYAKEVGEAYAANIDVDLVYRRDRFGRGGDHTAFSQVGYPAVRFSEKFEDYRHQHQDVRVEDGVQYGDLPEFFDAGYCARIAQVNGAVLASLADAPPSPTKVAIKGAVSYDTTLSWDPVQAKDLAGYQVLIRDTSSPVWERRVFVGNVPEVTLDGLIVDNYFFAVQSVDSDGNVSLPVFPNSVIR